LAILDGEITHPKRSVRAVSLAIDLDFCDHLVEIGMIAIPGVGLWHAEAVSEAV
jgi:hypothetical protein